MSNYVFDIETDGLLKDCTRVWIVAAYNITTNEMQYWDNGDTGWMKVFDSAKLLVGHNILGFDFAALEKLYGWTPKKQTTTHDTLLMSQILNYKRFESGSHSLDAWGQFLHKPKQEHEDWTQYSEEMKTRCLSDVELNVSVYKVLLDEYKALESSKYGENIKMYMKAEHAAAKWCYKAQLYGWPFDKPAAEKLLQKMEEELTETRNKLMPLLGFKAIAVDKKNGEVEPKVPKYTKAGHYNHHTAAWFNIDPILGLEEDVYKEIVGPYSRVEFAPLDLDSVYDVKVFLFRHGWQPTEWNYKFEEDPTTGRQVKVKTSPKITEDSLEVMEGNGKLYCDFLTTKSRHAILKTWINECDSNNRLHGECFTIGTPSMRARHSIIVNVPSADAPWGKEMRSLFTCLPGYKLIGCDSAGNQARGLAHYLKNEDFTHKLLHEDIHTYNASVLTSVLHDIGVQHTVPRSIAKRILYAFLFGASGGKLWGYIFGSQDDKKGKKLKARFLKAVPGFKDLMEKLENIYGSTSQIGHGYIPGIGGNRIYCDSFHKLLVYLLQAAEKATCSAALMKCMEYLEEENIPYQPCIFYHDEIDFMVPEEHAQRACELGIKAFQEGPKLFKVSIMDGGGKIGDNWYDVH